MKPTKTKREIREEMDRQLRDYLERGGAVKEVPQGMSGREDNRPPSVNIFHGQTPEQRTLLPEVVAAIEARRRPFQFKTRKPRPRKRVILDDFGQPLRWEWVEE
jgi:hypothetical protein